MEVQKDRQYPSTQLNGISVFLFESVNIATHGIFLSLLSRARPLSCMCVCMCVFLYVCMYMNIMWRPYAYIHV